LICLFIAGPNEGRRFLGPGICGIVVAHEITDFKGDPRDVAGVRITGVLIVAKGVIAAVADHAEDEVEGFGSVRVLRVGFDVVDGLGA
jgi:hypothetical protein